MSKVTRTSLEFCEAAVDGQTPRGSKWIFGLVLSVAVLFIPSAKASLNVNPGINYTGRIMKADGITPVTSNNVSFSVAIYDINRSCLLYTESRSLDLSTTAGTFSFDIGDNTVGSINSFKGNITDIYDLFNNNKAFTGLTCNAPHTGFTAAAANEPRLMMVSFDAGDGSGPQNLPPLKINPVPAALQAYKLNGYGTGDLLRIDSAVDKTTNANTDLTQTEYDEFWRLIKNPGTAYTSSATSLAGDVTGPFATNTVVKIQGVAVSGTAPTNGQILMYSGGAWTPITPAPSGVASVTASLPLSVTGSSTSNISISQAGTSSDGYLSQTDWNAFNAKQTSSLPSSKIWVGNASGLAAPVAMTGDVSIDNTGVTSLSTTGVVAGTYSKVTVDSKGRVTVGGTIASADITAALGYTPVNKAGDVMLGNLSLHSVTADPVGLVAGDAGKMWYRSDLNAIRYWDGSAAVSLGLAGAGMQSLNGLTATAQSFVTGTSGTDFNISSAGSDHTFNIPTASAVNRGALSSADWSIFNNKMGTSLGAAQIWVGNASGVATPVALSGDATIDNAGVLSIGAGKITAPMLSTGGINAATSGVVIAGPAGNLVNLGCATSGHVLKWTVTGWTCAFPDPSLPNLSNGKLWVGNSGNAATEVTLSGDVSIDNAGVATLANSGVAAGTYSKVTVDSKGRVTVGGTIASADITAALGYTPVNKAGDVMLGNLSLNSVTSDPAGLVAGDEGKMWYRSDLNTIRYWDGSAAVSLGVAGAGMQSLNGLTATAQSFVIGTTGSDISVSSAGTDHTFNIPTASAANRGALSSADWTTFNNKMSTSLTDTKLWIGNSGNTAIAVSMSGDATIANTGALTLASSGVTAGTYNKVTVDAKGRVTAGGSLGTSDLPGLASSKIWVGNASNAADPVSVTGDITMDNAGVTTLASSGVTAGTYTKVSVDAKGRVTAGASLASSDVTSALGYTPVNKAGDTMGGVLAMGAFDITNTGNISMAANKYFGLSANSTNGTVAGQMWYDTGTIKYYDGSTVKSLGIAGAGITNINGLTTSTQSFVVGSAGTDIAISSAGSAHTFDIPTASASNRGALSSADWTTFNNKMSTSLTAGQVWVGNASNVATPMSLSGDISSVSNTGVVTANKTTTAQPNKLLSLDGSGVAVTMGNQLNGATSGNLVLQAAGTTTNYSLTFPAAQGGSGQVLSNNGSGALSWASVLTNSLTSGKILVGNASNVATEVSVSGDATMDNAGVVTLASSGVTAGTYTKVTVDAKGRVTVGASLASSDVTSALGYTPVNKAGDTMGGALAMGAFDITNTGNISMAANKYFGLSANSTNGTVAGQMWYDAGTIKYYDGSVVKSLGVAGAGITNINGLTASTQSFVVGSAGTDIAISSAGSAHTFDIPTASASNRGALSSADWTSFNNKMSTSLTAGQVWVGNASNVATPMSLSGDISSVSNAGVVTANKTTTGQANKLLSLDGSSVGTMSGVALVNTGTVTLSAQTASSTYGLKFPAAAPAAGQVLQSDASGNFSWAAALTNSLTSGKILVGNASNVATEVSMSGDATMDNAGVMTLASSGVTAGTYTKVTVDAKGRVTVGASLASSDVTSALGYTPVNKAGDTMGGALAMGAFDITNTGNISMAANKYFGLSANSTNGTVAGQMWYDAGTIKYYDGSVVKSLGVAGAGITNINGLSTSTQSFVTGTAGTDFGISSSGSAHTFNIPTASASNRGALSSADWTTFNSKMSNALTAGQVWVGNASNVATPMSLSGDISSVSNAGVVTANKTTTAQPNKLLSLDGSGVAVTMGNQLNGATSGNLVLQAAGTTTNYSLTFPAAQGGSGQVLSNNGSGALSWASVLTNSLTSGKILVGNASNVATEVSMSGDATMDNAGVMTLASSGVTAGTYTKVTVDAKGRVTVGASLASSDVTSALGYTPVNKAGDTMGGALAMGAFDITNTGNISMAANKYFGLSANSTNGTVAGQMWYDAGTIKYYDGSVVKSLGVAGAGITTLNGLSTGTQSFVTGTAGTDFGISSAGSAHTFNIPTASASNRGALSSADWTTFNSKMSNALTAGQVWVGNASNVATSVALSGDISSVSNAGVVTANKTTTAQPNKLLSLDGSGVAVTMGNQLNGSTSGNLVLQAAGTTTNYSLTFPAAQGGSGQVLSNNGSGALSWASVMTNSLTSGKILVGNASNVATEVSMSGDATMSNAGVMTLASSGVTAGTYTKVTVDAKGRVTAGASLASSDVTSALGYTPVNKAGDTMGGALAMGAFDITNTGNISMAANKYFGLSANSTNGTVAGQMWYDAGTIKYYDGSVVKSLGVAGAGITTLNGLTNGTQSFVTGTAGTDFGISSAGSAHTFNIPTASASNRGALSSADWTTFNSKMSNALASTQVWVGNASGVAAPVALSGDISSITNAGVVTANKTTTGQASKLLSLDGSSVGTMSGVALVNTGTVTLSAQTASSTYGLKLPAAAPAAGQVLQSDASGNFSWASAMTNSLASGKLYVGNASGIATAVSMSGDATMDNAGVMTLASSGVTAGTYAKVAVDSKGRVTSGLNMNAADITAALTYTPVNKAGDTMGGALAMGAFDITNTGNISMAANKYFGLSANSTNGTVAGQMWYDAGTIKYYDGSVVKSLGVAGAGITTLNGLSTGTQSFVTGTAGTDFGISSAGSAHTFNIPTASASNRGALSSADWTTFNSKMSNALTAGQVWVGNASNVATAVSLSGDISSVSNAGVVTANKTTTAQPNKLLSLDGSGVAVTMGNQLNGATSGNLVLQAAGTTTSYALTFPAAQGGSGQVLSNNGSGALSWASAMTNSLASGKIYVGNASGIATAVSMSGDATMDNAGVMTLASSGVTAGTYAKVAVDAKGRVTSGLNMNAADITAALTYTPVNKAGDTMGGALAMGAFDITNTGNISMAANKYLGLSANSTNGTVAGQMWYDAGTIKYYDGSTVKSLGVAGAGITTLNGLSTATQSFVTGTAGTDFGISSAGSAHTFNIPTASASNRGALSSADWTTFNSKMSNALASTQVWVGNASGVAAPVALSGDISSITNAGVVTANKTTTGQASKLLSLDGSSVGTMSGLALVNTGTVTLSAQTASSTYGLKLPAAAPAAGQVLQSDASGNFSWASAMTNSLASGKLYVGNASGIATAVSMSGDATMDNAGVMTLASSGVTAGTYAKVAVDAKGRVTAGLSMNAADITTALTYTPVNKAGDTMGGALAMGAFDITNTGNISMAANKYFGLSANSTNGTVAGQMWYDAGTIKYYDGSTVKSLGVVGTGIVNMNGLTATTQTFATGTTGTDFNISSSTATHTFNIPTASASNRGALSSADWTTFNNKMSNSLTSAMVWVGNASNVATPVSFSGDISSMTNAGVVTANKTTTAQSNKLLSLDGSGVAVAMGNQLNGSSSGSLTLIPATVTTNYSLTFPGAQGASGQVLSNNGAGVLSWVTPLTNSLASGKILVGNASNVSMAVSMSGDATMDNAGVMTLASSGVTAGTYTKVTVDAKGRVTAGASLASSDVTTALGFTPASTAGVFVQNGNSFGAAATLGTNDAYALNFETNSTTRMSIDTSGNVGVGTTTPKEVMHLKSASSSGPTLLLEPSTYGGAINYNSYWDGTNDKYLTTETAFSLYHDVSNDSLNFLYAPSGSAGTNLTWNKSIIIRSTGNVGIGIDTPGSRLQVNTNSTSNIGQIIKWGASGQTANLLEFQNNTGTILSRVDKDGKFIGDGSGLTNLTASQMPAALRVKVCEIIIGDPGAGTPVLANDNDSPAVCGNMTGQTMTITSVECYANAGSPTVTPIITGGSATSILTGALTCGTGTFASGTLNGTPTQSNGGSIDANITTAGGTAKYIVIRITRTL